MAIDVISIGSSSSGNSYIIRAGGRNILLDVGLTAKKIIGALDHFGIEPEDIDAVLVTHEHVDHVRSVRAIARKCSKALFIASRGTVESTDNFKYVPEERLKVVCSGDDIFFEGRDPEDDPELYSDSCNNIKISAFNLSHDAAEPLSYTVTYGGEKLAVVTDTGIITDEIYEEVSDADMLVFEANHDEELLMFGEYPYPVKVRIKSDFGHLSNRYAGELLARFMADREKAAEEEGGQPLSEKPLKIMLAHLSFHNNAPFYARSTIESILKENGYERDVHYTLSIAAKDEITLF